MEIKTKKQATHFSVHLTNSLLFDRLYQLAAEYSLPAEQLVDLAVQRFVEDVELVRSLRAGTYHSQSK